MRLAGCLSLLVIGVSFLMPSDTHKFLLFLLAAGLAYFLFEDARPGEEAEGLNGLEGDEFAKHWFDEGLAECIGDARSRK
ncbi:hypothetical protein [Rhizobium sp. Root482]|jgi:hypothetical protein|uniref:hypothetical protein n=1 Tax=Rhizobium sp. Root482 TaxID=1736543 RepID=UPI0006FA646D|nr:hypothetical protein [Rhizobium sp. Root482]KQY27159.1 hypothetical protein ASD31_02960 [Rhizobium sp. Root482]